MKQKNLFLSFICIAITGLPVCSQTIEVEALEAFSTAQPPQTVSVKLLSPVQIDERMFIEGGTNVQGKLINIKNPKRLKRNANFSFELLSYTDDNGNEHIFKNNVVAKYTTTLNKAAFAQKAVVSAGNQVFKGLKVGVAAIEGAVKNEQGNRFKSGARSVYESTPISYVEKGKEIYINDGEVFYLKFPKVKTNTKETT